MAEFTRENPPTGQSGSSLTAWLARLTDNIESFAKAISETVDTLRAMRQLAGVTLTWQWSDVTDTTVDPGAGMMRGNQINVNVITQLSVSNVDLFGRVLDGSQLNQIRAGDIFVVSDTSGMVWFYYTLDTTIVNNGAWLQLNVTGVDGQSGNPGAGDFMENKWLPNIT